jgi:protein TonB
MSNINKYQGLSLDDIVFEGRNKAYGAYLLRKIYESNLLKGFITTLLMFILFLVGPIVYEKLKPEPVIVEQEVKLVDPKMIEPPPIDPKIPPPPPLPSAPPPPKISTVKFVPPEVAPDEEVIDEEPPKQEELKNAVAGTETVQGDPDADPNLLSFDQVGTGTGEVIGAPEPEEEFTIVEQMPTFGDGNYMTYLQKNIKYPPKAAQAEIQGTVYVSFVVNSDGRVSDAKLLKGIGFGCDEEALRVISNMPPWNPGKQGGRPVKVRMSVPVKFKLAE